MLSITKLQAEIGGSYQDVAVKNCDLAYCIKPTRQSWDFNEEGTSMFYTNLGIDFIKVSFDPSASGLAGVKVGDELNLKLCNAVEKLGTTFVVREVAMKNGFVTFLALPKLGVAITEEVA